MTINVNIDGKQLVFANEAECDAYRRAIRAAEPPLLQAFRRRRDDAIRLLRLAQRALEERRGRTAAVSEVESRLRDLCTAMTNDIKAVAEREQIS